MLYAAMTLHKTKRVVQNLNSTYVADKHRIE